MVNFGQSAIKKNPNQELKTENNPKPADNSDIATAEYSYFHIHQIKTWSGWSVNQEEVDYIVDPPLYLRSAA